jgi:endonuclease/exonuclease/phosphatase (EEP) superfamily protein YafD
MSHRRRLLIAVWPLFALALLTGACSSDDGGGERATDSSGVTDTTAPAVDSTSGAFSYLTYNVAGLPQEVSSENPEEHIPLISPLLEPFDVVVTQEDFDWWTDDLAELDFVNYHERLRADTTHEYVTAEHPGPAAVGIDGGDPERPLPSVGDGLGILSRFPLSDEVRVPWDHCRGLIDSASDCLAMKGFMVATVELADGVEVDVYTLHAEAGSDPEDNVLQEEQFAQLAAFIDEHSAGRAIILGGDTNLHLEPDDEDQAHDTPVWDDFLVATGLTDVCSVVECPVPGAIDKVAWRDADGLTLAPQTFVHENETFSGPEGQDLSDHPPVSVDWTWTAEP